MKIRWNDAMDMNALRHRLFALLLGLFVCIPAAFADDIEIYTNTTPNAAKPPLTVLVLDLDLNVNDVLCSNVLTATGVNCDLLRSTLNLGQLLDLISVDPAVLQPIINLLPVCGGLLLPPCPQLNSLISINLGVIYSNPVYLLTKTVLDLALTGVQKTITNLKIYRNFLRKIIASLAVFRLAVMISHAEKGTTTVTGGQTYPCNFADLAAVPGTRNQTTACSNGGYVLLGFIDLLNDVAGASLTKVLDKIDVVLNKMSLLGNAAHPFQGKEVYNELAHYLKGMPIYNGHLGYFDYADTDPVTNLNNTSPTLAWDPAIENGANYRSALDDFGVCDNVNVLNVLLTNSQKDNDSNPDLATTFPNADLDGNGTVSFAELVANAKNEGFLYKSSQITLNSYFVINGASADTNLLQNLGVSLTALPNLIGLLGLGQAPADFLQPVLITNAMLQTPSITADITKPGVIRTESFFGGFKPSADQHPRWAGNLKKLEVKLSGGAYGYFDATGKSAIASDGRIRTDALTFWTNAALLGGATTDGREATLGGAGQRIPGYLFGGGGNPGRANTDAKRILYYDKYTANVPSLTALDADNATVKSDLQTSLGAASLTEAQELLLYARGFDVGTTSASKGVGAGLVGRSWLHGAVLHSRPVAVNYGARTGFSAANPDIRLLYGSADGWLRMLANTASGGTQSGAEKWAFMPRAVMGQQKVLRDDQPARFPYGVDGAPTVLVQDRDASGGTPDGKIESTNANDKAIAYFGLRRGGSSIYALDIVDPDAPKMLWRIGSDGQYNSTGLVSGSATQFAELGLTYSSPQVGRMRIKEGSTETTKSVVVFAGGYNGGRDAANARLGKDLARGSDGLVGSDDTKGNALYIVDALTGDLIWKANKGTFSSSTPYNTTTKTFAHPLLTDSIPSDTTVVDTNGDGLLDRLYVADTGGRLWRADFPGTDRAKWTLTPLASVGRHNVNDVANDRRFFHAPDYVPFKDKSGVSYDAVVFASGDREDPLNYTTQNWLYAYRDNKVTTGKTTAEVLLNESDLATQAKFADLTSVCASGAAGCGDSSDTSTGWKLKLAGRGEKGLSQPVTTGGTIYLTSYLPKDPTSTTCIPAEGTGRLYGVSVLDSRPTDQNLIGDSDTDKRSGSVGSPGLPGEINTLSTNTIAADTRTLQAMGWRTKPVFWRERRNDDEQPP